MGYGCDQYQDSYLHTVLRAILDVRYCEEVVSGEVQVRVWFLGGETNQKSHPGKTEAETLKEQFLDFAKPNVAEGELDIIQFFASAKKAITALQALESYMQCRNVEQKQDEHTYQLFSGRDFASNTRLSEYVPMTYLTPIVVCDYSKESGIIILAKSVLGQIVTTMTGNGTGRYETERLAAYRGKEDYRMQYRILSYKVVRWLHEQYRKWRVKRL